MFDRCRYLIGTSGFLCELWKRHDLIYLLFYINFYNIVGIENIIFKPTELILVNLRQAYVAFSHVTYPPCCHMRTLARGPRHIDRRSNLLDLLVTPDSCSCITLIFRPVISSDHGIVIDILRSVIILDLIDSRSPKQFL